jgi:hypothetical protein
MGNEEVRRDELTRACTHVYEDAASRGSDQVGERKRVSDDGGIARAGMSIALPPTSSSLVVAVIDLTSRLSSRRNQPRRATPADVYEDAASRGSDQVGERKRVSDDGGIARAGMSIANRREGKIFSLAGRQQTKSWPRFRLLAHPFTRKREVTGFGSGRRAETSE